MTQDLVYSSLTWAKRHKRNFKTVITAYDRESPGQKLSYHNLEEGAAHYRFGFEDVLFDSRITSAMTLVQAERLLEIYHDRRALGSVLIHCYHGIARSSAIALVYSALDQNLENIAGCFEALEDLRYQKDKEILPNILVLARFDEALGRPLFVPAAVAHYGRKRYTDRAQNYLKTYRLLPAEAQRVIETNQDVPWEDGPQFFDFQTLTFSTQEPS